MSVSSFRNSYFPVNLRKFQKSSRMQSFVWVDGIRHLGDGQWVIDVMDDTPSEHVLPAHALYKVASANRTAARQWSEKRGLNRNDFPQVETNFADWLLMDPNVAASIVAKGAAQRHRHLVFQFSTKRQRILIPACLLMSKLFSPLHDAMDYLLAPQGIETFCVPNLECNEPGVWFKRERLNARKQERCENSRLLSWIWCFPSARATWDSVFEFANMGTLGLTLPMAKIVFSGSGVVVGEYLLATNITIQKLTALEEPFPFANNHPKNLTIKEETGHPSPHSVKSSTRFLKRPLSDLEWTHLEPLFMLLEKRDRRVPLRKIVDAIHHKFSTNTPWRSIDLPSSTWMNAQYHFRRWVNNGAWGAALEKLVQLGSILED